MSQEQYRYINLRPFYVLMIVALLGMTSAFAVHAYQDYQQNPETSIFADLKNIADPPDIDPLPGIDLTSGPAAIAPPGTTGFELHPPLTQPRGFDLGGRSFFDKYPVFKDLGIKIEDIVTPIYLTQSEDYHREFSNPEFQQAWNTATEIALRPSLVISESDEDQLSQAYIALQKAQNTGSQVEAAANAYRTIEAQIFQKYSKDDPLFLEKWKQEQDFRQRAQLVIQYLLIVQTSAPPVAMIQPDAAEYAKTVAGLAANIIPTPGKVDDFERILDFLLYQFHGAEPPISFNPPPAALYALTSKPPTYLPDLTPAPLS